MPMNDLLCFLKPSRPFLFMHKVLHSVGEDSFINCVMCYYTETDDDAAECYAMLSYAGVLYCF